MVYSIDKIGLSLIVSIMFIVVSCNKQLGLPVLDNSLSMYGGI